MTATSSSLSPRWPCQYCLVPLAVDSDKVDVLDEIGRLRSLAFVWLYPKIMSINIFMGKPKRVMMWVIVSLGFKKRANRE